MLRIADSTPPVRSLLERGVGASTIAIIDFGEHYFELAVQLHEVIGVPPPTKREALELSERSPSQLTLAGKILQLAKINRLSGTIVPRIESLLREVARTAGLEVRSQQIFDRQELSRLDPSRLQQVVAKASVALGDALAPDRLQKALVSMLERSEFLNVGYVAFETLGEAVGVHRVFDAGDEATFAAVQTAHTSVIQVLEEARASFLAFPVRVGRLRQEDSRALLQLQAADIAAGFAAQLYQRFPYERRRGAHAVKEHVDNVLFNDDWL